MNSGRELDTIVAEKVMGIKPWPEQDPRWGYKAFKAKYVPNGQKPKPCLPPNYSTDIAAAWQVVEHIKGVWDIQSTSTGWTVRLAIPEGPFSDRYFSAKCPTVQHAICIAALMSMEHDFDEA